MKHLLDRKRMLNNTSVVNSYSQVKLCQFFSVTIFTPNRSFHLLSVASPIVNSEIKLCVEAKIIARLGRNQVV